MLQVTVTGQAEMRRVADRMRRADRQLDRDLTAGIRRAVRPLGGEIKRAVPVYMPSGYAPVLAGSIRATTSVRRVRNAGVSVKVYALGKVEHRDVASLDRGVLAHPLWGNRKHWYRQRVKSGVVTDQFQRMRDPILDEMERVVESHVERIAHG